MTPSGTAIDAAIAAEQGWMEELLTALVEAPTLAVEGRDQLVAPSGAASGHGTSFIVLIF